MQLLSRLANNPVDTRAEAEFGSPEAAFRFRETPLCPRVARFGFRAAHVSKQAVAAGKQNAAQGRAAPQLAKVRRLRSIRTLAGQ